MWTPLIRLVTLVMCVVGSLGLHIVDLVVPEVVQNGSRSSVILDCAYRYEGYEKEGLVVKWFWNHEPEAVYQWIPGNRPESMGILKNRVNLDYVATRDNYTKHRALEVLRPTTELTGSFTCSVSSFHDEEFASKKMIVYAPATSMNMTYNKPSTDSVNITCDAHGIFPEPRLMLYKGDTKKTRSLVGEAEVEVLEPEDSGFSVYLEAILEDSSLQPESIFECVLFIPDTQYKVRRQIMYFPGYNTFGGYSGGLRVMDSVTCSSCVLCLLLLLLLPANLQPLLAT